MRSTTLTTSRLRRVMTTVGIAGALVLGQSIGAQAATDGATINTYRDWDGTSYIFEFGHPDTTNYGQVITSPAGKDQLRWFTFWLAPSTGTGTMTLRGEVYTWDGTRVGEEVFESRRKTFDFDASTPDVYQEVKIRAKGAPMVAGQQYVLFLTVSKDYETTDPNLLTKWAFVNSDVLSGGDPVYLNDGGDESQWDTVDWSIVTGSEFAMKAKLR